MITTLAIFGMLLNYLPIALFLAGGYVLYRHLSLPSFPYIGAHYLIRFVFMPVSAYLVVPWANSLGRGSHSGAIASSYMTAAFVILGAIISLLIGFLIFLEIAHFITVHRPDIRSGILSYLAACRKHVKAIGIALVLITLVPDLLLLGFSLYHYATTAA